MKFRSRGIFAAIIFACALSAPGEAPFSFEATPGNLPKDIIPQRYAIRIEPSLEKETFRGSVAIDLEVRKPVRQIVLHAKELTIEKARLTGSDAILEPKLDPKTETLTLSLPNDLPAGAAQLTIEFFGKLSERPQGLYITRYPTNHGEERALITQFEATDARRMFPCWDEPVFRAKYQLTVVVPAKDDAVSNMPIEREQPRDDALKEVAFAETPSMPSYLLALCTGKFEVIEDEIDGIKLRVFTTEGKREQGRYAMQATKLILPYYNDYFGVKYPLPKLDQLSFASTASGGMENWGCIIYTDTAFLYDPATSSQRTKERVFEVIAHEIAHQWFGDYVTMAWWDNLWLNEGFASWMGTKATDHFNPDWKSWLRAADEKEWAMRLDARSTTHPIQQPITRESQVNDIFDVITYSKGQAFLRMLETWLGEEPFRDGLRLYMKRHAYSNATTADLWAALGEASRKPVAKMAAEWTEQP
ncbi:MAG: M1 family metallopeptidase, partial [Chthoniobacteraceae bacterium]